ncbi:MAG: hypothetical protein H6729_11110 [Deltaproteobacteria bacterium]|nr:hypothetical protein [Deltaproteobacteria bacterium]
MFAGECIGQVGTLEGRSIQWDEGESIDRIASSYDRCLLREFSTPLIEALKANKVDWAQSINKQLGIRSSDYRFALRSATGNGDEHPIEPQTYTTLKDTDIVRLLRDRASFARELRRCESNCAFDCTAIKAMGERSRKETKEIWAAVEGWPGGSSGSESADYCIVLARLAPLSARGDLVGELMRCLKRHHDHDPRVARESLHAIAILDTEAFRSAFRFLAGRPKSELIDSGYGSVLAPSRSLSDPPKEIYDILRTEPSVRAFVDAVKAQEAWMRALSTWRKEGRVAQIDGPARTRYFPKGPEFNWLENGTIVGIARRAGPWVRVETRWGMVWTHETNLRPEGAPVCPSPASDAMDPRYPMDPMDPG